MNAPAMEVSLKGTAEETIGLRVVDAATEFLSAEMGNMFADPLHFQATRETAANTINGYLDALRSQNGRAVSVIVNGVRLELNDYVKDLGISLASLKVMLSREIDGEKDSIFSGPDEFVCPRLGVIPANGWSNKEFECDYNHGTLVKFPMEYGGEEITVLSGELAIRGFLPGEPVIGIAQEDLAIPALPRGSQIIAPQESSLGILVPYAHHPKLNDRKIPYIDARLAHGPSNQRSFGGVYFCRYLTNAAVRRLLNLSRVIV